VLQKGMFCTCKFCITSLFKFDVGALSICMLRNEA